MYPEGKCIGYGEVPTNQPLPGWWNRDQKPGAIRNKTGQTSPVKHDLHRLPVSTIFRQPKESGHRTGIKVNGPDPAVSPDHLTEGMAPDRILFTNRTKIPLTGFRSAGETDSGKKVGKERWALETIRNHVAVGPEKYSWYAVLRVGAEKRRERPASLGVFSEKRRPSVRITVFH